MIHTATADGNWKLYDNKPTLIGNKKGVIEMGKIKTHKASAKRFTVTANGKVKMFHSSHRHNTGNKSAKRLRHLRSSAMVNGKIATNLKTLVLK